MRLLPLDDSLREIDVYVLVSRTGSEFYVWKIKHGNAYQAYKDHVNGKFARTKDLFAQALKEKQMPRMYVLETLVATQETAYRRCLAWTRYFMEQGLTPLSAEKFVKSANDLLPETQKIFDELAGRPPEQVLSEENLLVADYHREDKFAKRTPKDEIKITVSHEEYEQIRKRSQRAGLSMSRYCRNMALDGKVYRLESPPPWEYIAEIRGAKITLRQILYAVYQTGAYTPADMEKIEEMSRLICEEERKFTKAYSENTKQLLKLLPK